MENPVSLIDLKRQFKEMVGFRAPAPISQEGAVESAEIIVETENKLIEKKVDRIDMFRVVIATSQLLQWSEQENRKAVFGRKQNPGDPAKANEIANEFKKGNLSIEEIKNLTKELYVANPMLGAKKAMELLESLHTKFPDVSLKQDLPNP